jgi:ribosomal protein S18 acetylase RimI-like enzyme
MSREMTAEIRAYVDPSDRPGLRRCAAELQEYERALDPRLCPGEEIAEGILKRIFSDCKRYAGTVLVATDGEMVVGYASVYTRAHSDEITEALPEFALVGDLSVLPSHRGRGIGKALLDASERHAAQSGARWLRISTLASNEAARRLYAACGFEDYEIMLEKPLAG